MSQNTLLMTQALNWQRARQANATDNGYPSKLPTATEPANSLGTNAAQATSASVFDWANPSKSDVGQNGIMGMLYGVGANNVTFSARVIGWRWLMEGDPNSAIWVPTDLCELQATLSSTLVGLAGKLLTATDCLADTITLTGTTANANVGVEIVSPANDRPAYFILDVKGFQKIEFIFTTGASATSCNTLWSPL